jgi:hypothetical protein
MNLKRDSMNSKSDSMNSKFDSMNLKADSMNLKLDSVNSKPDSMNSKSDSMNLKLDSMNLKPDSMNLKLDSPHSASILGRKALCALAEMRTPARLRVCLYLYRSDLTGGGADRIARPLDGYAGGLPRFARFLF